MFYRINHWIISYKLHARYDAIPHLIGGVLLEVPKSEADQKTCRPLGVAKTTPCMVPEALSFTAATPSSCPPYEIRYP
eukprot:m.349440 g.349440  ORF g.349440 m.349440 type:complete len:78 (-) comp42173_c0_seq1:909-1142(-)